MEPIQILNNCVQKLKDLDFQKNKIGNFYYNAIIEKKPNFYDLLMNLLICELNFDTNIIRNFLKLYDSLVKEINKKKCDEKQIFINDIFLNEILKNNHTIKFNEFFYHLKILSLLEYFKLIYLNVDKNILNFIFCFSFYTKYHQFDKYLIKFIFANFFFGTDFYEEKYKNFIINNIYPIIINLLNEKLNYYKEDFLEQIKFFYSKQGGKFLKYYNMIHISPYIYLIELLSENKFKKAEIIYSLIKKFFKIRDEDIYIDIMLLSISNRITEFKIIEKIVFFFKEEIKINKDNLKKTIKDSIQKFIEHDKNYLIFSDFNFYKYNLTNKTYEVCYVSFLNLFWNNLTVYNDFCLLENFFDIVIINDDLLYYEHFVEKISKYEKKLNNNKTFKQCFGLYQRRKNFKNI